MDAWNNDAYLLSSQRNRVLKTNQKYERTQGTNMYMNNDFTKKRAPYNRTKTGPSNQTNPK